MKGAVWRAPVNQPEGRHVAGIMPWPDRDIGYGNSTLSPFTSEGRSWRVSIIPDIEIASWVPRVFGRARG
jgi:hypothetical protein